ncbi:glycosyltransferase family protein [Roseibium sediminicola]|uniref:Glycosyltransferase n=1 Tax=Roseibium sediminicola TaxID=2933272 RepID=A0ABT0H3K9_9HYPH|nr:glycosyltransferase [Roseibium sp. CAU 1639]MCK7616050.1 glycosyltransferase [Roseibium sp. CAU 1639]
MKQTFDVLFVADPRFEGGSSTALALELRVAARAGYRTGLMMVRGPIIGHPFPIHPEIREVLDAGLVERTDPDAEIQADLVLVHHPSILDNIMRPRPRVRTGRIIVVLHHPVKDATGRIQYELEFIQKHAAMAFGIERVDLAPVSQVVRDGLPVLLPNGARVLSENWDNLIELHRWPRRKGRSGNDTVIVGRHSRPDPKKWPDTLDEALLAWPDRLGRRTRMLGGGPYLSEKYGALPPHWEMIEFNGEAVSDFLSSLDVWVYFHSSEWVEAFGRTTLEAMATGVPVILPEHFRCLFGDNATYAELADVDQAIADLTGDPDTWQDASDRARQFAERHNEHQFEQRLQRILAECRQNGGVAEIGSGIPGPKFLPHLPDANVLFVSSNGIGMGHLVQQLAIADRLPTGLRPVFVTFSYAMKITVLSGYPTEFLPHHRNSGMDAKDWNDHLAEVLLELLLRLQPRVIMYDATAAFDGAIRAFQTYDAAFSIWVRRAMWQESHRVFLPALNAFDAVIEPGELAEELDLGPTTSQRERVLEVAPVLHIDPSSRLPRPMARQALGLSEDAIVVAMQLGGGNNYALDDLKTRIVEGLLENSEVLILDITSPIRTGVLSEKPYAERVIPIELFPAFRYSNGFDAAVSAAGYNAFHENIIGGIPTLFVPNEGIDMDLQVNRAIWAELAGCSLVLRRDLHQPKLCELLSQLLDPHARESMRRACRLFASKKNGADEIAAFVEDHARLHFTDRNPAVRQ